MYSFLKIKLYIIFNFVLSQNNIIDQYKKILPTVLFNSFVILPILMCLYEFYYIKNTTYSSFNLFDCLCSIIISFLSIDFLFYVCHRILHNKYIYIWSHKKHHEFKYPVGIEALYLHWFDLLFGNALPFYFTIIYFQSHLYTLIIWNILIIGNTIYNAHSSYKSNNHINHHIYFKVNYGIGLYMDKVLKTKY